MDWFVKSTLMVDQAVQLLANTVYLLAITVQPEANKARVWAEVACDNDDPVR